MKEKDKKYMQMALDQACMAKKENEVPVGAVVVLNDQVIARAHNQTELLQDVTAHAEILATTIASDFIGNKFLNECDLYVTLEPCSMCAGALFWARYKRVIFGAKDEKRGYQYFSERIIHPKTTVTSGIMEEECSALLKAFFKDKRL